MARSDNYLACEHNNILRVLVGLVCNSGNFFLSDLEHLPLLCLTYVVYMNTKNLVSLTNSSTGISVLCAEVSGLADLQFLTILPKV